MPMQYVLIENIAILICSAAGFVFGAYRYLRPKKPLYASMIVLGLGCIMLGRLFQCVRVLTGTSLTDEFQIGILGIVGAFSFFLSANYGQIDSLVDDGGTGFRRFRAIAWCGPLVIAALYALIAAGPASIGSKIGCAIAAAVIARACYYHLKHLIIPDVEYGVVRCQRTYNALALCIGVSSMLELIAAYRDYSGLFLFSGTALCALCLLIVPVMDRGVRKWTA